VRSTTITAMLVIGAWAAAAPAARAAQCGKPDLVDMVPPDKATGVPLNATLGAHYATSAEYVDEPVVLVHPDGSKESLAASWDPTEQFVSATPGAPLEPGGKYTIQWPALRGLNAAAPGMGGMATFIAGTADDLSPPTFAGVRGVTWDLERAQDDCVDGLVERFVFDIALGVASDDGGTSGLTLLLYQTEGPQVMGEPTPLPGRAWPQDPATAAAPHLQVRLATGAAVGEICFAGIVRDSVGQFSQNNNVKACVQTTAPPFFNGCAVAGSGRGENAGGLLASLAALALVARRRKQRAPR
jgi:hypothetical protein